MTTPPSAPGPAAPPPPARPAWPAPAAWPPPPTPLDLPLIGVEYPGLLRTPRGRWWNPLASGGMVLALLLALTVVLLVPMSLALLVEAGPDALAPEPSTGLDAVDRAMFSAPVVFLNNLGLIALVGVALLAVLVGHPVRARFLHSVQGRVRWRWLLRCAVVLLPLFLVYVLAGWALDGAPVLPRRDDWVWLLLMALVMTPFQAAGEEYLFRGWPLLAIGTWIRRPGFAVAVAAAVSAVLFALAHGSLDPWILLDLAWFAVACTVLTWRTGGLEAAVALHAVNNVVILAVGTLTGTGDESYVTAAAVGDPLTALVSVAVVTLATALLLWQARRAGVERTVPVAVGARP